MGAIDSVVKAVMTQPAFGQDDLERELAPLYRPISLAAMVRLRHAQAAVIEEYAVTIEEAIEAHILGLDHVAVAGLVPVIEGAARRLATRHGVASSGQLKPVLRGLIDACKSHAVTRQLGAVGEVLSMLESFRGFLETYLYAHSETYPLADRTNRHGIAHGAYADRDYGRPLNFYKTIAAVDFLTFVSTFIGGGSWFAPAFTPRTLFLARDWLEQRVARDVRLGRTTPKGLMIELAELRAAAPDLSGQPLDEALQL